MGLAFVGRQTFLYMNKKMGIITGLLLSLCIVISSIAFDFSRYMNMEIDNEGNKIKIHQFLTFKQFMDLKLGKQEWQINRGLHKVHVSSFFVKTEYWIRLLGIFILSLGILFSLNLEPFCKRHEKFFLSRKVFVAYFKEAEIFKEKYLEIIKGVDEKDSNDLESIFNNNKEKSNNFYISLEIKSCPDCLQSELLIKAFLYAEEEGEFKEIEKLALNIRKDNPILRLVA